MGGFRWFSRVIVKLIYFYTEIRVVGMVHDEEKAYLEYKR